MSTYSDMPVCDLRMITAEMAKQIEDIHDIALLILPSDAPEEVMTALAAVQKSDIASMIYLSRNELLSVFNGCVELTDNHFSGAQKCNVLVNGVAVLKNISGETAGSVLVNGMLILHKSLQSGCSLAFPMINGLQKYLDFDDYKVFPNQIDVDVEFLSYLEQKTLIIAGNQISIQQDVSVGLLKEKQTIFIAGNKITCYQDIAAYVKTRGTAGNAVEVLSSSGND